MGKIRGTRAPRGTSRGPRGARLEEEAPWSQPAAWQPEAFKEAGPRSAAGWPQLFFGVLGASVFFCIYTYIYIYVYIYIYMHIYIYIYMHI